LGLTSFTEHKLIKYSLVSLWTWDGRT